MCHLLLISIHDDFKSSKNAAQRYSLIVTLNTFDSNFVLKLAEFVDFNSFFSESHVAQVNLLLIITSHYFTLQSFFVHRTTKVSKNLCYCYFTCFNCFLSTLLFPTDFAPFSWWFKRSLTSNKYFWILWCLRFSWDFPLYVKSIEMQMKMFCVRLIRKIEIGKIWISINKIMYHPLISRKHELSRILSGCMSVFVPCLLRVQGILTFLKCYFLILYANSSININCSIFAFHQG